MYIGKFTAVIEAEFNIPENTPNLLSFEEMHNCLHSEDLIKGIHDVMMDYVFPPDFTDLKITPSTRYLYKEDKPNENLG